MGILMKNLIDKQKAKEDLETFSRCWHMVLRHFEHDQDKTNAWFLTEHFILDGLTPMKLYTMGSVDKLEKFIKDCLDGS